MSANESRPAGAAPEDQVTARSGSRIQHRADTSAISGPRLGVGVLVVHVRHHSDGREIQLATADAEPGRNIRLIVGSTMPPLWVRDRLRSDLRVQVEATNEKTLAAWLEALGGGR